MNIENKLRDIGFIIKKPLKEGKNRVGTPSLPNELAGWVYIRSEFTNYGSWDNSIDQGYFFNNDQDLSKKQKNVLNSFAYEEQRKLEEEEKIIRMLEVREEFQVLRTITSHPYLDHKQSLIDAKLRIDHKENLAIPMYNINKQIFGYQTISIQGNKYFKPGSILKESFFPILEPGSKLEESNLILLAEGYATASSIFQAAQLLMTKCAVISCFSVGNIDPVFNSIRKENQNIPILIVKDNDSPGYLPINMGFVVGKFGEDANDVHCRRGLEELRRELELNLRFVKIGE